MDTFTYRKDDFLQTGSAEIFPIYLRSSAIGAAIAIRGPLIFCFSNGVGYGYGWKVGIEKLKKAMLAEDCARLQSEFSSWKRKWDTYDDVLFGIATTTPMDPLMTWRKLDEISKELWTETYKIEALDNFAEEIERSLSDKMKEKDIDHALLHEMISPGFLTVNQRAVRDRKGVRDGSMTKGDYIRKYWFINGRWSGGELLDERIFEHDAHENPEEIDFGKRREIHAKVDSILEKDVVNVVRILRLLAVWREERKAQVQKYCLGYAKLVDTVAQEMSLSRQTVEWSLREEFDQLTIKQEDINGRSKKSAFIFSDRFENSKIMSENEAQEIMNELSENEQVGDIRGMTACKGYARGRVRIVIRNDDFAKFSEGDILVTTMTRTEFLNIMKLASAIVTDEGGLTCHAAILSREFGIPCVVGTKTATKSLRDGDLVEVDAGSGTVRMLEDQ